MIKLGVNIDHVATLRQARMGTAPDWSTRLIHGVDDRRCISRPSARMCMHAGTGVRVDSRRSHTVKEDRPGVTRPPCAEPAAQR